MFHRASQVLDCLIATPLIATESGFPVETRTAYGIHGEKDDLAFSIEWRDADGCLWAADFSEEALELADLRKATVSMSDAEGTKVVLHLYKPAEEVELKKTTA
jgi:hypothetical protein